MCKPKAQYPSTQEADLSLNLDDEQRQIRFLSTRNFAAINSKNVNRFLKVPMTVTYFTSFRRIKTYKYPTEINDSKMYYICLNLNFTDLNTAPQQWDSSFCLISDVDISQEWLRKVHEKCVCIRRFVMIADSEAARNRIVKCTRSTSIFRTTKTASTCNPT